MESFEELFKEFDKHLMLDEKPSEYFNIVSNSNEFLNIYPLSMLWKLKETPQSPIYHPEGSVWNHTMLVVDEAAKRKKKSENPQVFMWSALLHDIGKGPTTKMRKGRITSYDHDKVGKRLSIDFLKEFQCDEDFIKKVSRIVRWHMHTLFVAKNLPFADIKTMLSEVDAEEIALFSLCDRLGRGNITEDKIKDINENINYFMDKCKKCQLVGIY